MITNHVAMARFNLPPVITHLIEHGIDQGFDFESSFRMMGNLIEGSQAIAATFVGEGEKLCALRIGHAGGVVVAHQDGQGIVASDLPALLPLLRQDEGTTKVGFLEPGEVVVLTPERAVYQTMGGTPVEKQLRDVEPDDVVVDKAGFSHFMLKEIMEQPQAVVSALRNRVDFENGLVDLSELLLSKEEIKELEK